MDISGWDLKKSLLLFRKSNPPLLEWLGSPIVYLEQYSAAASMRGLLRDYYSPATCLYHYLHMARGNYREYLKGDVSQGMENRAGRRKVCEGVRDFRPDMFPKAFVGEASRE